MNRLRSVFAGGVARLVAIALRVIGRSGTSLPGKVLLALDPGAITERASALPGGSIVVSATNGKTTTCAVMARMLERDGQVPVHNRAGANMAGGIASTLISARGDVGLFEVDEFWLDRLVPQLRPRVVVLANLFRDQLDRYGELDEIISRWREVVASAPGGRFVLNADDPSIAALGGPAADPVYFGVRDDRVGSEAPQHATEQVLCPECGSTLDYRAWYVGHLGDFRCSGCDWERPRAQVTASEIELRGLDGSRFTLTLGDSAHAVEIPLPGLYNVYNALAAAAGALAAGVDEAAILAGLAEATAVFGRAETVTVDGRECDILLVKNPAGANEVMRTVGMEDGRHDVLFVLNDLIADGRDVSWIWDADFENIAGSLGRAVCSGTRAVEMALRLKYAGVHADRIEVIGDLEDALHRTANGDGERMLALPTYTAMLELRELLVAKGAARESFA